MQVGCPLPKLPSAAPHPKEYRLSEIQRSEASDFRGKWGRHQPKPEVPVEKERKPGVAISAAEEVIGNVERAAAQNPENIIPGIQILSPILWIVGITKV